MRFKELWHAMTQGTRERLLVWAGLVGLWFMVLPPGVALDPMHSGVSPAGAVLWVCVLVWLVASMRATWMRVRLTLG